MLFVISCIAKPNNDALKEKVRQSHIAYLEEKLKNGVLAFSSPLLSDDGKKAIGSFFIISVKNVAEAKAFADGERYNQAGIFSSVTIHCIRKGRRNPALIERE